MTTKITSANITQSGTSGISSVAWQAVQTTGFTAVAGRAYPCNTTSAAFTVTLPASPTAGNVITLTDYAGTWDTNNLTINPNGGKLNGLTASGIVSTKRGSVNLVYIDSTQGWISYSSNLAASIAQTLTANYLVIAGGGGGGYTNNNASAGGGAGGMLSGTLTATLGVPVTLTVGAGGPGATSKVTASNGNPSVFSTVTSLGGGGGSSSDVIGSTTGANGGSGGGGGGLGTAGPPRQGYDGGSGGSGGGGGAGAASTSSVGGTGAQDSITGTATYYAAGGTGGTNNTSTNSIGGRGESPVGSGNSTAGATNTGSGGGGAWSGSPSNGKAGGSGVVIIKIPNTNTATFSGGVTSSLSTAVAGYKIYTITNTSTTSETVTFS